MAKRWPPMVGIVGFDGGYKPAVALALPPDELGSDEGEQEGGGGPGDQTGACCNPDGSCDEDVTQFDCTSSGGIFQGVGTDCDPNPCEQPPATGACCIGTDCSIQTQEDCESGGGTYQGDDTTCDPNPCISASCCSTPFQAFDGSCRFFLTKTVVQTASRTEHITDICGGSGDRTSSLNTSDTYTVDPDTCEVTCVGSGSGGQDYDGGHGTFQHCVSTRSVCGQTHFVNTQSTDCTHSNTNSGDTPDLGDYPRSGCYSPNLDSTTDTATTRTVTFIAPDMGSIIETLSDEVSITGACCDFDSSTCSITTSCDCVCGGCSWFGACSICDECGFSPFADPFFKNN